MYLGPPCYGYALNCHLVNLAMPRTRPLCVKNKTCLFYLCATAKSEVQICSNKHETGRLVFEMLYRHPMLYAIYNNLKTCKNALEFMH